MKYKEFLRDLPFIAHFPLDAQSRYFIMTKPLRIWDSEKNKYTKFSSMEAMWDFVFDGKNSVKEKLTAVENFLDPVNGGRGSSSGKMRTFAFGDAKNKGTPTSVPKHFPAEANTRIKEKTQENAIDFFAKRYRNADHEYGMLVDKQGFVHEYNEGGTSSVFIGSKKGTLAVHNHPGGGAFSKSDLVSTARTKNSGIVAIGKKGDYYFEKKGGHFKSAAFEKAVKKAKMKGKDYDDAVRKWLTENQKKYGYKFTFKKR